MYYSYAHLIRNISSFTYSVVIFCLYYMFRTLLSKSLIVSGNIRINMASDHNFIMAFFNCGFISSDIVIEDKTIDWVGIVLVDEHSPSIILHIVIFSLYEMSVVSASNCGGITEGTHIKNKQVVIKPQVRLFSYVTTCCSFI